MAITCVLVDVLIVMCLSVLFIPLEQISATDTVQTSQKDVYTSTSSGDNITQKPASTKSVHFEETTVPTKEEIIKPVTLPAETCNPSYPYRSADGSCNNLLRPNWGRAGTPFRRLLTPAYDEDDGNTPRIRSKSGTPLPSARRVSTTVHPPLESLSDDASVMLMQWGQFLDHDMTHTVQASVTSGCCENLPRNVSHHPDVRSGGPCYPILVPDNDPYFTTRQSQCLSLVRSAPHPHSGHTRQQFSDTSAYIDGSQIYGNTEHLQQELRVFEDGKLKVKIVNGQDFLPEWNRSAEGTCFKLQDNDYCFLAGDERVNVYPGLTAMHTVFLRYHNLLCDRLKIVHKDWDDEKLYQESRRIVGAILQKVTFSEYLKTLLGEENARLYNLLSGDRLYWYKHVIDATLTNEFTTAAFRFGHSSIPDYLDIGGEKVTTGQLYMRPKFVLNSLTDVIQAVITGKARKVDRLYSVGVTDQLFEPPTKPRAGWDLVARNIQRGRDHGVPDYNTARAFCDMAAIEEFDQMETGKDAFRQVYESPDDIDIYSGQLSELPYKGGRVGRLLVCLLGIQFRSLKFGDRFWYENQADPVTAFSSAQISEINHLALAKVICDVTGLERIQPDVFRVVTWGNGPVRCSAFRDLEIGKTW